jgi:hypothetical protein
MSPPAQNVQPKYQGGLLSSQSISQPPPRTTVSKPNYNISLSDVTTISNQQQLPLAVPFMTPPNQINQLHAPTSNILSASVVSPAFSPRPGMGDILTPLKPQQRRSLPGVGAKTQASKDILSDFDPLA